MKKIISVNGGYILLRLSFVLLSAAPASAQNNSRQKEEKSCGVTSDNSKQYLKQIAGNIKQLAVNNHASTQLLHTQRTAATPTVKLIWPLSPNNVSDFSYYRITNYVDLDTNPEVRDANDNYVSGRLDYNCGTRNYDGHNGMDISLMPYHWKMQNDEKVSVVAAADGIIVGGADGNYDENCDVDNFTGPTWGNWLAIMHNDSTVTTYIHLKSGSVIPVTLRQRVQAGQFLGYVASAGRSSGPHLHFGAYIYNSFFSNGTWEDGDLHEPFNGSCNNAFASFWQSQKPYNEPSVISIETHNVQPGVYSNNCDKTVTLGFDKTFSAGNIVYSRTWFRDWIDGSQAAIQLLSPSGTLLSTSFRSNSGNSRSAFKDENFALSGSAASGTYTVRVTFDGKTWERYFTVGCVQNYTVSGTLNNPKGYIAGNSITTTQVIESGADNRVEYHADGEIVFSPGFHAKTGSHIIADTKGCTSGYH